MVEWKRICCPVDFSRESRIAMEDAADLARRLGGVLTLVHVQERAALPNANEVLASPETLGRVAFEAERALGEWKDAAERITNAKVGLSLLTGDPADEVVRLAAAGAFDVIVMGTHARAERERLMLGSVASAVVREAPCTVIVVRHPGLSR